MATKKALVLFSVLTFWPLLAPFNAMATSIFDYAKSGDVKGIEDAIKKGEMVNRKDKNGFTPLHYAAWMGHTDSVHTLINHGAYVNVMNTMGETPISMAAAAGQENAVRLLLAKGARIASRGSPARYGLSKATLLHLAAKNLSGMAILLIVDQYYRYGINVDVQDDLGDTPLCYAANGNNLSAVKLLVESFANVNAKCNPLELAASVGNRDMIIYLTRRGAKIQNPNKLLLAAAAGGQKWLLDILLEEGANINARSFSGDGIVTGAVLGGHPELIPYLVKHGADVNAHDDYGNSALHTAALTGNLKAVQLLENWGANLALRDKGGMTAADLAKKYGKKQVFRWLTRKSESGKKKEFKK